MFVEWSAVYFSANPAQRRMLKKSHFGCTLRIPGEPTADSISCPSSKHLGQVLVFSDG